MMVKRKTSRNPAHGLPRPPAGLRNPAGTASRRIVVTDRSRLGKLLIGSDARAHASTGLLAVLEASLESAIGIEPESAPEGLVTMNSQVRLVDLDSGQEMTCSVVYPEDVDLVEGGVSILEPLGLSLIGRHAGDCVEWRGRSGRRRMRIAEVLYQPEQEGAFHR